MLLSRRHVRIKIMQVLYGAYITAENLTPSVAEARYRRRIDETHNLYLLTLLQLQNIIAYTQRDTAIRAAKLLPTDQDRAFTDILFTNPVAQSLLEHEDLQKLFKTRLLLPLQNPNITKQLYHAFVALPSFLEYQAQQPTDTTQHREIILELFKFIHKHDLFLSWIDDCTTNWDDDKSLVIGAIKRTLKGLPDDRNFTQIYQPDHETCTEFGSELLQNIIHFSEYLAALVTPRLQNWEESRVTPIDMVMIRMGIAEFLYCPSINTSVTMDEYIEIAKTYSTDKSQEFINGILDNVLKHLLEEGKILKQGRGLI